MDDPGCGCEHRLPSLATPDSLAYLIYTSGSTGRPKGAMIHHRGWSNLAYAQRHLLNVKPGDRVLQFASLSFDASASEIAMALGSGATLVLGPRERRLSGVDLTALVRTSNIVTLPPTVLAALEPEDLPGLESLIVAGEAFPLDLARRWSAGKRLFNGYGPTEATIGAAMKLYDGGDRLPIGRPLAGMQIHVLDARGNLVPVGVAGELCVGGVGLARGYLGRPDRTAESFVPNPLASLPGERLYRTGDLALHRRDGEIEFLGRLDHQVKIRGFRIELGEIETALAAVPGVREAVVVVREDRLVAYVTGDAAAGELRSSLRERLPDYMVPAAFVNLRALPLNPNGKVDRKALPAPEELSTGESHVAPRTPVEEVLAGIWAELLGLERVGADDRFFDLGGHSLLATRVTSRLRGVFGIEVPLRDLFEAPRLADFAIRIEEMLRGRPAPSPEPIAPILRTGPLPLSFAQQRLWFIDQLEPGSPLYNVPAALRVEGPLDPQVLALCLGEVVRRHEALRTTFTASKGFPEQVIQPAAPFGLSVVDLVGLPETQALALVEEEAGRPFDLARGPLLRCLLLRLAEDDHIVALTMHHIVSDGWSAGVLVREVAALYPAFAEGKPSPLPELPVQYADFAVWQRSWLQGEVLESELSFWRRQLSGLPPLLELPTDRPRPAVQSFRGASQRVELPALGRHEGATLFMVLLAGFQALLARYSGQDDLAVGSPIAGRNRVEIEGLIGFFVNTLVLRGDLTGTPTFRELLARVRETALAAYLHQDMPFEKLVEELEPERSLAHAPLFQVMLVLQNAPFESLEIEDLRLRPMIAEGTTAKFDLTLAFEEKDGGLSGTLEYATDLFDASTIGRLFGHLERFLTAALEAPERSVSELPLLSPAERHQAIVEWSDTEAPPASGLLFHELLTVRAKQPALAYGQEQLTHDELAARSDHLAAHLRALGVGPDVVVAIFLERSIDLVVALLAVLKAGGAYLPLDVSLPSSRLSFLLDDSRAPLVLTRKGLLQAALPEHSCRVVCLDDLPEIAGAAVVKPDADNLAYVLYTSGSTGQPKGVAVTHRGLANYLLWAADTYPVGEGAPVHSPVSFDLTVTSLFLPLLAGRCVELVPEEKGIEGLASALAEGGFGLVKLTPAHLDVLQRLLAQERVEACARVFIIGGEPLSGEQLAFWRLHAPGLRLINEYGPTETVVGCCTYEIPESMPLAGPVPIGRPIANTRILILDPQMSPVPIGVPGELYIGGAGLCRGYLHRPGLTAEKLVPDPFGTEGERLYRTGDLARRLPDGRIEFLGRLDLQVKIRGFRIELGEIEAALVSLAGVREAAVDVTGGRLVAYVTGDAAAGELRRSLRERLPDYMVPAAFVKLEALPLNPNGKVDRKALPAPESAGDSHVAPRTPVEEVLAGIWAELLGLEQVGADDRFFDLGGHSLLATQVTSRLRSVFGIEVPLRDLFEAPRLADLAARIEGMLRDRPAPPLIAPALREGPLPLSFAQQRLWFVDQLEPGSPLYNVPAALRVEGPLDPQVLALCLGEIVRRHEALRTTFTASKGFPEQVIHPAAPFVLSMVDLAGLPETQALPLVEEEAGRPFDLARGPLLRCLLLRLAEDDHIVALTLHHIVSDGWSAGVLVREVAALYPAFAEGRPSPLSELPVQYADFAVWQRSWLQGEALLSFWRRQLAGLPPLLELPTDRPRPGVQSFRGASQPVELPALGRHEGATLFMVLLAGFQALLARYSGQDDLAVGSPIAGRNRVEIEGLIGFFVNTLVLRGDLTGTPTFRELLGRVRATALAAYLHQDMPFEKLVEELAPERSLAHAPLFQVMLALQNAPVESLEIEDLRLRPMSAEATTAKFDLTLAFEERDGRLRGTVEYATDLFDASTIHRLCEHFERLLDGLSDDPERPVAEVSLLSAEEALQLTGWNATARDYPRASVHELFARQVERAPDAVVVIFGDRELTYGELDLRSRRLARRLRLLGVGSGSLVGLCTERSAEMVIGMLGILAAGGAYVPLDPAYPEERLAFMLDDTGASVLVAQEHLAGRLPSLEGLHVERLECEEDGPVEPASFSSPEDAAYVIYTSGSTGRPKGVVVPHRAIVRLVRETDYIQLGPEDRVAQAANSSFDATTFEVWGALLNGARLVGIEKEVALSPPELVAALDRGGITALFLTTALFNQVAREEPGGFARLRYLLFGGELVDPAAVLAVLQAGPPENLLHVYGPTEATTFSSWHRVESVGTTVPIGGPLANGTLEVLDRGLSPVPVGVPGELFVGGDGLAHGYHARPDLTAERFVPHPLPGAPGARLYRTGDLVRRRPDGAVEFLGRLDHQVKIRGFRVEPGEIEAALMALPGVREAVVMTREEHLAAYVAGDATVEELRRSLRERLPDYMVPASFVVLKALPLTPNGKVDRKALPAPDWQGFSESYQAPRTPVEEVLAGIWAEVLGLERVGAADRFFDLGGHSLLATRVLSRMREAFKVELPLRDLFEAPALSDLAARIEMALQDGAGAAPPLVPVPREGLLPLSFAQERFWVLDQLEPGNPTYNMPGAFELAGHLDVAALAAALDHVASRHEVLRTVFRVEEGAPRQHILPSIQIGLPVIDLSSLPDQVEAKRLAAELSHHRFNLARGPLLAAALLRLGPDRHHLLLVLHHAVCDGWSLSLLVREIGEIYAACAACRSPALDRLRVQYADFAVWQRNRVAASRQSELAWWLGRLAGEITPLDMPADRMRPAVQTYRGGRAALVLPAGFAARLAAFGRAHGTTLFMTLLAAIKALLHRHSGQDDILVGAPVAGRRAVETEGLIGCFLNTLVLRTDVGGEPGFRELVARVREVTLGAYSHQDVPFEAVLASLPQQRDLSRTPLFQVMVNLLNLPSTEVHLPGVALESLDEAAPLSKFDMTFYVSEGDGVHVELVYNADLFDAARMEDLLDQLDAFLDQALDRPDEPIGAISLVTAAARAVLPDPTAPLPAIWSGAVHERFAERARQHPDRPAVSDCDGVWSYGDLEAAANRLSAWLHGRGVMQGDRVAVYAHRSAPLALALLGALKAGAAFTILDPAYPAARLTEILVAAAPRGFLRLEAAGALPGALEEWLRSSGCPALELPRDGLPGGSPGRSAGPDDPAWMSFTSGSTGVPKGVLGSHRPLSHFIAWHSERFGLAETDRFSLLSGLAHDPLLRDLFTPLCLGAVLAIPQPEELTSPGRFADWMQEQGITVAHLTPALSEVLTEAREVTLETLRLAFFGGDVLTRRTVERLRGMAPGCALVNYYGATETPQGMGFHEVALPDRERIPLGRGIDGVQLLVLNGADRLTGVGELGEICIRTPYLALGYLHDETLTRERFVANPFTGEPDDRLYRTGDLGRYLPDGSVDFQGRRDTQVKLRGFRIELGEIEAALSDLPGMIQAVVIVREDTPGVRHLVAYVVGEIEPEVLRRSCREQLRERLPEYMMPGRFVALNSLPLTPNGKVDRKALPAPERQSAPEAYLAPRTPVEEVIAGIWAEVLGLERAGVADSFFDLGGHSLLATRVMSRLRSAFGVEIPLRDLFEAPTVESLAARVEAARRTGAEPTVPPLLPVLREGALPLSFAQQRLWLIDRLEPGRPLYNMPVALRVQGPLDGAVFALCLGEIVRRHEALRTVFAATEGIPVQVVQPAEPFGLSTVDLSGLPESRRETEAFALAGEEAGRPFDLTRGPLLRCALLRLAERDHVAVLTLHHIASDGWSMGILVREVAALYAAFAEGRPSPLTELPVQYADFALWQRSWLRGEVLENEIAWWRRQLAGLPPVLELPTDRPRPALQSFRGATRPVQLPAELIRKAEALGRREGATLFMVLLAAFQASLARHSSQEDLAVGSPVAGRNRVETEGLIGFFVNTLILRGDLAGTPAFRELLGRVRETALDAYLHQDVPFEKLVEELAPERSLAHSPLFQVMLVLQNASVESLEIENLRLQPVRVEATTAKFDLTVNLAEHDGGLGGTVEYATDLFDAATIDRLAIHYERLLTAALTAPELAASELSLLSPAERHQAIAEWNDTGVAPVREVLLLELLAARAEQASELPALVQGQERLTHGELAVRSDHLATHLRALGTGPDVIVALFLERSVDLVVALLAVLKAGGAYLPLEISLPRPRLSFMLDDSRAPLLLTRTRLLPALPEHSSRVVCLDDLPELPESTEGAGASAVQPTADNLAYVLYTSGSTGNPKGVAVTHRGLANYLLWAADAYPAGEGRGAPVHSPVSFDLTVTSLFLPLLAGRCVDLIPEEEGVEGLAAALAEGGFGLVKLTPAHLDILQRLLPPERVSGCASAFVIGGEPLSGEQLAFWRLHAPDLRLINEYGPTETVVGCCTYEVPASMPLAGPVSIGRPIANTRILILDERLYPVPIGVSGELYVAGKGVCRGYLHRPDLTAEKLTPDPFGAWGERLYRTGDLARRLPDGTIEFLGRSDHQVKLRGFRIELGEIETALASLPGVREAVVVVREDRSREDGAEEGPGERRLVAYVDIAAEDLRRSLQEQLRERLPEHMIPAAFVALSALPLTPNGKVDRKALPAPDWQRFSESYQAPRTPVEEVLAGIWGDVLGLERVGAFDRFFDLGGHSLMATRVLSRVREAFGIELPLRDLFEAPMLSAFAARVETALLAGAGTEAPPLVPVSREGELPLSFAQQRLWFLDQLEPNSSLYNIQVVLRVEGPLDGAVLALCLGETLRRHEVLRTVYAAPEGSPVQVIQPAASFLLPVVDLSGLPENAREGLSLALAKEEATRPFDLARGLLLRSNLLRLTAEDHAVVLTLHHIASDGWSMGILVHELTTLYAAFAEGRPSPLPELPVQYADFAVWQGSWLKGEILERKISFWRSQLAGLPPRLEMPTDRPRPAAQSYRGASRPMRLPAELMGRIRALGGREGATLFMVLLAGFQTLLARYSGQQDLAVGTPIAGRNRIETEGLIGFFVNTLVLRGDLSGRPSFKELLGRVRETALAAYLHQDLPFEKLVQELSPERSLSHSPLFQVMLTLQNAPVQSLETGTLHVRPMSGTSRTAKFDLELILQEHDGGLAGVAEYAVDLFDSVTVDRLIVHFEKLLTAALTAPEQAVSELPLLAPSERWQTLHEWNDTERAFPKDACIQDLFAEQAARTPHAVAVSFKDQRLTYRELDERAGRLARWLIDRSVGGVGTDVLVAVLLERSLEMIVALVGILKAGGAYAPLEPGLPPSRLRWLLDDVRSPVLLTQTALLPEVEAAGGFEGPVLWMDEEKLEGPGLGDRVPSHPLQLAYVNYTSGSTGMPKGVVVPHLGVTRLVMNPDYMEMGPDDVILQLSTYAWDAATWEIWGALLNGGHLVMIPRETVLDFRRLAGVLAEERITALYLTTALFNQFVEQEGGSLAGLSTLIIGGETASVPHFQKAVEMLPRTRIINEYGPTENTSYSSWQLVRDTPEQGALPIGKPLSNSTVYVLDRELQPMPLGLPGELFLGGDGLARGYLGRPDLTAERFVPHPFAAGERLYRTGDLGAWRPDGTLDFFGRMDFQVKIRGHRIEPAEVEDAIKRHEGVEDAVVLAYEPVPQDKRLVAYVTGSIVIEELREFLRERLPDYMVPASFVTLAALPLSPIGKVDRKALPPPGQQSSETSYVAPFTHAERALAEIWAELLGVERVGVTDDFFALGGHSLLAVRLMARIEQVFGVKLPLATLFEAPSVRPLAEAILGDPVWRTALVRLHPGGSRRPLFLLHPAGGDVFSYVDLAKRLGTERPVYGLQAVSEGGGQPTMEDLAARYLAAVREVQPEGPWLLAGWSAGAVTAYEMARQAGSSLVAMIDPPPPPQGRGVDLTSFLVGFAALGGVHSELKLEAVRSMLEGLDLDTGLDLLIELSRAEGVLPAGADRAWMQERFDLYSRTETAVATYVPRPYEGQVILLRASASLAPGATDLTSGWSLLARTEARLIPDTNHFSLLQMPALDRVVELLESALASFEGEPGFPPPVAVSRAAR